jgi:hypothetical protein
VTIMQSHMHDIAEWSGKVDCVSEESSPVSSNTQVELFWAGVLLESLCRHIRRHMSVHRSCKAVMHEVPALSRQAAHLIPRGLHQAVPAEFRTHQRLCEWH